MSDPTRARSRREFLVGAAGVSAFLAACSADEREAFFQRQFHELDDGEKRSLLERLERTYEARLGTHVDVAADPPLEGVTFGYALDLSRCVGCRRCVYACVAENNQSRDPQIHWIRVLEMAKEAGIDFEEADLYYEADAVPREGHFYMPVQCQQCEDPPCTRVCPVRATWKEPDGIVVVDYEWCIGCRYCQAACPYDARRFNWAEPTIPVEELNTDTHVLGNRPRPRGVMEKCTFCIQRSRRGRYPACVEVCPVGARKFGDVTDPVGEIRYIIENKRVFILKEELGTHPKFFYFYGV